MKITTRQYRQTAAQELDKPDTQQFLKLLPARLSARRKTAFAVFDDPQAFHHTGASIRAEALEQLPNLLRTFETNATANGAQVVWAADAKQANDYIAQIALKNNIDYVTKGKSMITEELGLNEALEQKGIAVWETDLGEFITQLLQRPPFHIVGPAINIPVSQISEIFQAKGVIDAPEQDPVRLGLAARRFLREKFHHLEMGVTGINMAVAETGTILNVENEGNIRLTKSCPRIQVSVMSMEKVVASLTDALHLIRVLCRSCTGQDIGAYVSMDSGPAKPGEIDGPEQLHIVILDNGRSKIYMNPETRDAMRCIRCGACLNACPIYGKIGGYPYGWAYSGPMGQILTPLLLGLRQTQDLFEACTLCNKCHNVCPVGIDHPRLMRYYRSRNVVADPFLDGNGAPLVEKALYHTFTWIACHPRLWAWFGRGLTAVINRYGQGQRMGVTPAPIKGWTNSRDLPPMPRKSFRQHWKEELSRTKRP